MKPNVLIGSLSMALVLAGSVGVIRGQRASTDSRGYIEGVVTSATGAEAGVWVIAETNDLPTKYAKIVVSDDQGRYVLPDLPTANYQVWVRGYGLVDSMRVAGKPGQRLDLKATIAPDGRAAAEVYPPMYWLALHPPDERSTPAAGQSQGTPISARMAGSYPREDLRRLPAGDYPKAAPPRPVGVERNLVLTMWDWGTSTTGVHTTSAANDIDPSSNANGRMYGADTAGGLITWVDPVKNEAGKFEALSLKPVSGRVGPRSPQIDQHNHVWYVSKIWEEPAAFCKPGSNKARIEQPLRQVLSDLNCQRQTGGDVRRPHDGHPEDLHVLRLGS